MPYLSIYVFVVLYLLAAWLWQLPLLVAAGYAVASLSCFVAYAVDKSASRSGAWRTPEATLLLLGAIGGWPGGVLAQQWLRHKTSKTSFQWKFQLTVALNIGLFLYFGHQFGANA